MSGVAIVRALLVSNAALLAAVPAAKIMAGAIPLATVLPAISVAQISSTERHTVAMVGQKLITERVQVTVCAKSYPTQKSILALVRAALPVSRGVVAGFDCDSVLADSEGPDIYDPDAVIYEQSQDFFVKFSR